MQTISVELITIGTELLLGQISDTNSRVIAKALRENGFDLRRVTTVGDDDAVLADAVRRATTRARVVLLTGGLGPTVDDPTRAAIARAAGVRLDFHPELWAAILARFQKAGREISENNRSQAFLPDGAVALPNPVGSAPGFAMDFGPAILLAMPGVPAEMEVMLNAQALPYLKNRLGDSSVLRIRMLHVGGIGESQIDERIGEWERSANPIVGLAAHNGLVDLRIAARGSDETEAEGLLARAEEDIRSQLTGCIFATGDDSLAQATLQSLPPGSRLASIESGTGGFLAGQLAAARHPAFCGGRILPADSCWEEALESERRRSNAEFLLAIYMEQSSSPWEAELIFETPHGRKSEKRSYAMAQSTIPEWAVNHLLFQAWKNLQMPAELQFGGLKASP
jgi:nicotinamide-nucleotide amidase